MKTNNTTKKALGLLGAILVALAMLSFSATSALASADEVPVLGKLAVYTADAETGAALAGAALMVLDESGTPVAKGLAAKDGSYYADLTSGAYKVWVQADGYADGNYAVEIAPGETAEVAAKMHSVTVPPADAQGAATAQSPQEGWLTVYALDAASSKALANATVLVTDEYGMVMAKELTGQDGSFGTALPAGIYKVRVFADGYKGYAEVVELQANEAVTMKAALKQSVADH